MTNQRYERGLAKLAEVDGDIGEKVVESLQNVAPDLANYIIEFAFGEIYCRNLLTLPEREIVTISSLLTAGGCEAQLNVHINASLNVGVAPEKIIEVFLQCIPYTGFPKVLNAVNVAKHVFADRNINLFKSNN